MMHLSCAVVSHSKTLDCKKDNLAYFLLNVNLRVNNRTHSANHNHMSNPDPVTPWVCITQLSVELEISSQDA